MSQLICIGEPLIRLSPPPGIPLRSADRIESYVGGAVCNVAVASGSLGINSSVLATLGSGPLANRIQSTLRAHGVTPNLFFESNSRVGCYWVEATSHRYVHYDRLHTPMASVDATTLLENIDLGEVTMVYVSGILPALSQSAANNAIEIVEAAMNAGCTVVVDANYRNKLWTSDDARPVYESLFAKSDIIVMASRDIESIFGYSGDHFVMGERLCQEFSASHVIVTQGADGALSISADGNVCSKDAIPAVTRDPIGAGDAFVGAVCACILKEEDIEVAIEYGVAAAAISRATFGDLTPLSEEKIRDVSNSGIVR